MAEPTLSEQRRGRKWRLLRVGSWLLIGVLLVLLAWLAPTPRSASQSALADAGRHEQRTPKTAFEPSDWPLLPIGITYLGVLALLVVSCFVLIAAYPKALPDVGRTLRINPPGPRLQTNPESDLAQFRAEEAKRLHTYYWIDEQKGIVHIPIEQAMKELARTGAPGFPEAQQ
ncbi:MAG TPA: hypothetical protein VH518_24565 [Tepidisphaeraceae bacterium]|jgi:hypothetical protein